MTFRRVAQIVGLGCVYTLGLLTLVGTGTNNPVTPTNAALQIPGTTPGMWQDVLPQQDGTFTVLPFATSVPIVKVSFSAPTPSSLHVTAQDTVANGPVSEIPEVSQSASMPTGFFIDGVDTTPTPARWTVTIKLPPVFQNSLQFAISISEVSGGSESAPLKLSLVHRAYRLTVALPSGGHVTSNPPGINCGDGAMDCQFRFGGPAPGFGVTTTVALNAGSFQTLTFLGWSGDCSASNSNSGTTGSTCTLTMDGTRDLTATASFGGPPPPPPPPICPVITYDNFTGTGNMPQCRPEGGVGATFGATCDSQGNYSCPYGAPFCPSPDLFKNPGGCYRQGP
jgi:hypothetical protein